MKRGFDLSNILTKIFLILRRIQHVRSSKVLSCFDELEIPIQIFEKSQNIKYKSICQLKAEIVDAVRQMPTNAHTNIYTYIHSFLFT